MTTIQIPATVGDLHWTVLSAVRLGTCARPAEFIAVIDCREGTPTERYATVQVFVWPTGRWPSTATTTSPTPRPSTA